MSVLTRYGLALLLMSTSLTTFAENLSPNLKFNGFATATGGVVDDPMGGNYMAHAIDNASSYAGYTKDPDFGLESLIGLQFDYRINDKTNVMTQIVAEGNNGYNAKAEWAYIAYQMTDNWRVRGGHMALPTFMYSDTIKVGQSYPWVRLPAEAYYGVPVTSFDGVDLTYRQGMGDWNLNVSLLTGGSTTSRFKTKNSVGLNATLANDSLTLHAGVIKTELIFPFTCPPVTIPVTTIQNFPLPLPPGSTVNVTLPGTCPLNIAGANTLFSNAGAIYDDGQWFVAGEFAQLIIDGWANDWNSGYVSVGHYFGKWLPYVLASKIDTFNGDDCTAIKPYCNLNTQYSEQTTYAIGTRYALSDSVSVKGQIDHVGEFNATTGFLDGATSTSPDAFNVLTISLTAAF